MQHEFPGLSEPRLREHRDCRTLTGLMIEQLPDEGSVGRARSFGKGTFVWTSESTTHYVYFLKRGQVAIMVSDDAGCEVIVRVVKPGESFGELCFCSAQGQERNNCASATVDSVAVEVGLDDFTSYLQRDIHTLLEFTFTFCKRLADAERRIEVLSHRGAEARLGRLLLQLAGDGGKRHHDANAPVKVSLGHDELARMAAMTRPHVSVTMGKLRARGLVNYDRGSQLTVNAARLSQYLTRLDAERGDSNRD